MDDKFVHTFTRRLRSEKTVTLLSVKHAQQCGYADAFDAIREFTELGVLKDAGGGSFTVDYDDDKIRAFKHKHGVYIERRPLSDLDILAEKLVSFDASLLSKIQEYNGTDRKLLEKLFDQSRLGGSLEKLEKLGLIVCSDDRNVFYSTVEPKQSDMLTRKVIDRESAEEEQQTADDFNDFLYDLMGMSDKDDDKPDTLGEILDKLDKKKKKADGNE